VVQKNTRIIRLDKERIGVILDPVKLLVIRNEHLLTMGTVPEDIYPIHPDELVHLTWQTKVIINAVLISHGLNSESPFLTELALKTNN